MILTAKDGAKTLDLAKIKPLDLMEMKDKFLLGGNNLEGREGMTLWEDKVNMNKYVTEKLKEIKSVKEIETKRSII